MRAYEWLSGPRFYILLAFIIMAVPLYSRDTFPHLILLVTNEVQEPLAGVTVSRNYQTYCGSNDTYDFKTGNDGKVEIKENTQRVSLLCMLYQMTFSPEPAGEKFYNYSHINVSHEDYVEESLRPFEGAFLLDSDIKLGETPVLKQPGELIVLPLKRKHNQNGKWK